MSLKEQTIILTDKDSQGNTIMQFPITKAKNIEDVMGIAQGGTGVSCRSRTHIPFFAFRAVPA